MFVQSSKLLFNAGDVAELADALDLGSSALGRAGSIPVIPTYTKRICDNLSQILFSLLATKDMVATLSSWFNARGSRKRQTKQLTKQCAFNSAVASTTSATKGCQHDAAKQNTR